VKAFCAGCLTVQGPSYQEAPQFGSQLAEDHALNHWPLVVLVDDVVKTNATEMSFLWTAFTRFEPGADIFARQKNIVRNHLAYEPPIVIDARMKPSYPDELFCDPETAALVDRRWLEYFPAN
jgi:hypothetical protein